jgi:hypothetical protein
VPRLQRADWDEEQEDDETALNAAIRYGRVEIVKKIGLDPQRDDATRLLNQYFIQARPEIIELLIKMGADLTTIDAHVIDSIFWCFEWGLDASPMADRSRAEEALRCMEILGSHGVRWSSDKNRLFRLRKTLARVAPYEAIRYLQRIANSQIMDQTTFEEFMRTPRMQEILNHAYPGALKLRQHAGRAVHFARGRHPQVKLRSARTR